MKSIIIYYSLTGTTRAVCEKLAEKLDCQTLELVAKKQKYKAKGFSKYIFGGRSAIMGEKEELQDYNFNSDDYDLIILATPLWASRFPPAFNEFFANNNISDKKIAVIATCDGGSADLLFENVKKTFKNVVATLRLVKPTKNLETLQEELSEFVKVIC